MSNLLCLTGGCNSNWCGNALRTIWVNTPLLPPPGINMFASRTTAFVLKPLWRSIFDARSSFTRRLEFIDDPVDVNGVRREQTLKRVAGFLQRRNVCLCMILRGEKNPTVWPWRVMATGVFDAMYSAMSERNSLIPTFVVSVDGYWPYRRLALSLRSPTL